MNKKNIVCRVACSPVRAEEKDNSEMVTQMLFGEVAILLSETEKWLHIQSIEDDYVGFVDPKHYLSISEIELSYWKQSRKRFFTSVQCQSPRGIIHLPAGCFVKDNFTLNNQLYTVKSSAAPVSNWLQYAMSFLNVSYLWGGCSHFGIDCSGFSQQVMRFRKIELPRDASQQVLIGAEIAFLDRKEGDVVFFQNATGKVTHVGILLEHNKIIHASGFVKIDLFTQEGIICSETRKLTHLFHSIKRYL